MSKQTTPDNRHKLIYEGFQTLIRDRAFRSALDALSEDVLIRCDEFLKEHGALVGQHLDDAQAADIISAVVGWILGMPAGRKAGAENITEEVFQHNVIAAYVSAWSAENSARVHRRAQQ